MKERGFYDVIIVGGGLAGLTSALHLSESNLHILLIEKHQYPHHKVCGEYISKEVVPYLERLGIHPFEHGAKDITRFQISDAKGDLVSSELPLGGFGMSRYVLDALLYQKVKDRIDVTFTTVASINFDNDIFQIHTKDKLLFRAPYVVGAHGKRSSIDVQMNRPFVKERSPWLGVKAHYEFDFPEDTVALHTFEGGYCGLSKTEGNAVNACYLSNYEVFKKYGNVEAFQQNVLSKNPHLKKLFNEGTLLFKAPITIGQISFSKKHPVEDHVFMIGDSAGLIHPLCGNGMAMAIHSAQLFSSLFLKYWESASRNRTEMEQAYSNIWKKTFSRRLRTGRIIQNALLSTRTSSTGFKVAKAFPSIIPFLIKQTHGEVIL